MTTREKPDEARELQDALLHPLEFAEGEARRATGWWWLYVLLGLVSIALGATALASRINAIATLVAVFAAFLLFTGAVEFVLGLSGRRVAWLAVVAGVASMVTGVVAFIWPSISLFALAVIVGVSLLCWGIYHIYLSFADPVIRPRTVTLIGGMACTAIGVLALAWPRISIVVLAVLVGVFFIVYGVFAFIAGLRLLDLHHELRRAETQRDSDVGETHRDRPRHAA